MLPCLHMHAKLRRLLTHVSFSFAFALCVGILGSPDIARAETPTQMTQKLIASMQACKEGAETQTCNVGAIESHLAITQLARWLMGPHWQGLGEAKQQDFTALLGSLLRDVAYPRAAEFLSSTQINYGKNQVEGKEALVETYLVDAEEGQVNINYRLHQIDGEWKVWDVHLDGVSMAGNLRKQVQSVMSRKSYEDLVERMKSKLKWDGTD